METAGFEKIGFHAALILNKLRNRARLTEEHQKSEDQKRPADSNSGDRPEKQPDEQREYVQHRLRELAAWERRISGKKN